MDLRQLRYFVTVAEELHFTRAAARLHLAQSALSAQVRALEREVGAELFTRTSRRVVLTEVGESLRVDARRLLADADAALGHARALARSRDRRLIVGCLGPASAELLAPVISGFTTHRRPDVSVDVQAFDFAEILPSLRDARADVAFVYLPYDEDELADFVVAPFAEEPRTVALATSHPLAERDVLRPDDLAGEAFVTRAGVPDVWRDFWLLTDQLGHRPPLCPRVAEGREEWLYLVASGQGLDTVPEFVARHYRWPGIAYVPLADAPPARYAVVRLRAHRSPLPGEFMDAVRATPAAPAPMSS